MEIIVTQATGNPAQGTLVLEGKSFPCALGKGRHHQCKDRRRS